MKKTRTGYCARVCYDGIVEDNSHPIEIYGNIKALKQACMIDHGIVKLTITSESVSDQDCEIEEPNIRPTKLMSAGCKNCKFRLRTGMDRPCINCVHCCSFNVANKWVSDNETEELQIPTSQVHEKGLGCEALDLCREQAMKVYIERFNNQGLSNVYIERILGLEFGSLKKWAAGEFTRGEFVLIQIFSSDPKTLLYHCDQSLPRFKETPVKDI